MRALSLFSGVGGFDLGFERAGIRTVAFAESDKWASEVLARHWPDTPNRGDVLELFRDEQHASVDGQHLRDAGGTSSERHGEPAARSIDLVHGGFPCQDLSVAGKRAGLGGERSNLWYQFQRILSELRPRWCVIENVPGLLSSNDGRDFAYLLESLGECGFDGIGWAILDAQNFGVPQRRRRVFIVGGPSRASVEQVLSICESCGGNPETGGEAGEEVAGTIGGGSGERGWNNSLDAASFVAAPVTAIANGIQHSGPPGTRRDDAESLVAAPVTASAGHHGHSSPRGDGQDNLVAYALTAREAKGVSQREGVTNLVAQPLRANRWGGSDSHGDEGNVVAFDDRNQASSEGRYHTLGIGGEFGVRRLTPLECERLMGWPDDWTRWDSEGNEIADSHRYRMCGNGVVATVAEWIGRRIMALA
jgi:DNA (cytosine-5)-methyltransferase 1